MEGSANLDRKLRLDWVNPTNLGNVWDVVKTGLEKVRTHGDHWRVEDVYLFIKQGNANLHLGIVDNRYAGFLVTMQTTHYDGVNLHIWCCYSESEERDILSLGMEEIREWAETINAKRICFSSSRKGWTKQADKLGFHQSAITYEMDV